jgi:hypothetical protein
MLLGEIKPANWNSFRQQAEMQLENYIDKANNNEDMKRAYGVQVFSPMVPDRFILPPLVYSLGKVFEIRWCRPGLILYKEVRRKDRDKDEKQKQQPYKEEIKEQRTTSADARSTSRPGIEILRSAPRAVTFESWTPEQLRRDISANTLADGLYRDRYTARWAYGSPTNVVVWVKTVVVSVNPLSTAKEYQYYQEYPTDPSFYEVFAKKRGLSTWRTELVRNTLTDYNRDLWSLIAPDAKTGLPSSRSPYYARDELRTIYAEVLKGVLLGSAAIVGAGASITSTTNVVAQRGTARSSVTPQRTPARPGEEPLPDWVSKNVQKGADQPLPDWVSNAVQRGGDLFRELEKQMRVAP